LIFKGKFEHSLDAKNRLTVPSRFREAFAGGIVLAISPEAKAGTPRCIALWRSEDYEAYAQAALAQHNPISPQARELKRILFNNAHDTELDSAYRVMIPAEMRTYAGLEKEVVLAGSGECLEVWDRATYAAYSDDVTSRFTEITERFGNTA
jgi:MraZ protein